MIARLLDFCIFLRFQVTDFGCAECRAVRLFRDVQSVKRIVGVDIDRQLLVDSLYRIRPLTSEYLFRRVQPLMVEIFHGNLLDWDDRLADMDAVTMIEV